MLNGRSRSATAGVSPADPDLTDDDRLAQTRLKITYTQSTFTSNALPPGAEKDHHRAPLPAEVTTWELTGIAPENGERFSFEEWSDRAFERIEDAKEIPYEATAKHAGPERRPIERVRTVYRKDDLTALSPQGEVESLALPGETYKLALTPSLVAQVFVRRNAGAADEKFLPAPDALLTGKGGDQGGYVPFDGSWWIPAGRAFFRSNADVAAPALTAGDELVFAREHFFVPRNTADAFDQCSTVEYDAYDLLVTATADAVGNRTLATNDYRVLQPSLVADPNRNRTALAFDALGMVVATAVMGKDGEAVGDLLEGFASDPALATVQRFTGSPRGEAATLLGRATTRIVYDLHAFARDGTPPFAATLARETHVHDEQGVPTRIQVSLSYSDGLGREVQKKLQAEPSPVDARGASVDPRWVGSGWTVFNNKGKRVRQYEPFFSATHAFEFDAKAGVSPVLFYDPVERVIATLHPNDTFEKVVFDPWRQATWDVNDTVAARGGESGDPRADKDIGGFVGEYFKAQPSDWKTWHARRIDGAMGAAERDAALKAAAHADTPTVAHLDALGRPFLTVAHDRVACPGHALDGKEARFATRVELDIEGNQRTISDAKGRVVMRYDYDMLGNRIHQASMEAGASVDAPRCCGESHPSGGQPRLRTSHDVRCAAKAYEPVREARRRRTGGRAHGVRRGPG